jgi:hypothetical protein
VDLSDSFMKCVPLLCSSRLPNQDAGCSLPEDQQTCFKVNDKCNTSCPENMQSKGDSNVCQNNVCDGRVPQNGVCQMVGDSQPCFYVPVGDSCSYVCPYNTIESSSVVPTCEALDCNERAPIGGSCQLGDVCYAYGTGCYRECPSFTESQDNTVGVLFYFLFLLLWWMSLFFLFFCRFAG